jgi:citrate lyase gamma subunit
MTRKDILTKLLAQHATLRALMDECDVLIAAVDLERMVARLSLAFDAHNQFEESVLAPILGDIDAFDDVRLTRMVADHGAEHRALRERLRAVEPGAVRATVATLREHLEAEERYFLSARVVRDDLVVLEGGA